VVPTLLASPIAGLQRAGAMLAAAACIDAGNAAILIKLKVLPQLVALSEGDALLGPAARTAIESLCLAVPSALLWHSGKLPLSVGTSDGFWAVTRDTGLLAVEDLAMSNAGPEVLHIDASTDGALAECIQSAKELVATTSSSGASAADVAAALARFVCHRLGGVVDYASYETYEAPASAVDALRSEGGSRVVPLGSLSLGSARHRAILFKALADRAGLMASLQMGACIRGAHAHHAWNTMILDGAVVVVDLVHAPGEFYAEGSDAARRYTRVGEFAFSSLTSNFEGGFQLAGMAGA